MKQVTSDHYAFASYESPERFTSYYYQMRAALQFAPSMLLEVGAGSKVFAELMRGRGVHMVIVDIDTQLRPSVCGSVLQLPLQDDSVDVVAAFQILEHLPFEYLGTAVTELARVSRRGIVVSLPEFGNAAIIASFPFVRRLRFASRILLGWYPRHRFDGEHYWEINKRGYRLSSVKAAITGANLKLASTWINPYNPYHRFFALRKAF